MRGTAVATPSITWVLLNTPRRRRHFECRFPAGTQLTLPDNYDELAAYVVEGDIHISHSI